MSLPTDVLIKNGNKIESKKRRFIVQQEAMIEIDTELDSRAPDEKTFHFGNNIFLPLEEYDQNGQLIISEVIGYDGQEAIWL